MIESYQPKRILVTGGAGFIGTNFVYCYAGTRSNLAALDDDSGFAFVKGDILDSATLFGTH